MSDNVCVECGKKEKDGESLARVAGTNDMVLVCKDCFFNALKDLKNQ